MMEMNSLLSVGSLVVGLVALAVGVALGVFASPSVRRAKALRTELDELRREHEKYKGSVNQHFRKTADLVGHMTKSYAAVYDHLAGGAQAFCDGTDADSAVPFGPLPGVLASPAIDAEAEEDPLPDASPDASGIDAGSSEDFRADAAAEVDSSTESDTAGLENEEATIGVDETVDAFSQSETSSSEANSPTKE